MGCSMNVDDSALKSKLSNDLIKSVTKTVLIIASVMFLAYLATLLPGIDYVTSIFGIDGGIVMGAVLTTVVVGLLLYLSSALGRLIEVVLSGPTVIVDQTASIARWVIVLGTILVAHVGYTPLVTTVLGDASWMFDILALLVALPVLLIIALRLYLVLDPTARYVTDKVTDSTH